MLPQTALINQASDSLLVGVYRYCVAGGGLIERAKLQFDIANLRKGVVECLNAAERDRAWWHLQLKIHLCLPWADYSKANVSGSDWAVVEVAKYAGNNRCKANRCPAQGPIATCLAAFFDSVALAKNLGLLVIHVTRLRPRWNTCRMSFLVALIAIVDSTPMIVDDNYNSPGTIGFIVTFAVAGIAVFLFFDMNRRIRKTRYRQEIREKLAEEELGNIELKKPDRPAPPAKPRRENPDSDPGQ